MGTLDLKHCLHMKTSQGELVYRLPDPQVLAKNWPGYKTSVQMILHSLAYINKESKIIFCRNANLAISLDTKCSPEGCWYCQHRCHSCMKPASVGYTWKDGDTKQLFYHCSNRCYHMYTGDIPESTMLDVKVGEIEGVPVHGTHLLLSATVLLNVLSTRSVVSTQVAVSYGSKEVPEGVVYVFAQLKKVKNSFPPIPFFIQHDLTPVKYVWDCAMPQFNMFTTIMEMLGEADLVKTNLQPVFNAFGCDDLTSYLEQEFPLLHQWCNLFLATYLVCILVTQLLCTSVIEVTSRILKLAFL